MKKTQDINWIDSVGIGLFMLSSIIELSRLIQYFLEHLLIIMNSNSILIIWVPQIISLLFVIIISILILNKMNKIENVVSRKNLKKAIGIFFVIVVFSTLYRIFGNDYFQNQYSQEFQKYYDTYMENLSMTIYVSFIPLLKYLAFGSILLLKRNDSINNNMVNQISEIGDS